MILYLLRHAEAEVNRSDDTSRHLTKRGYEQAQLVSKFMLERGLRPKLFLTSPVVRARETAEIVVSKLGMSTANLIELPWLSCGMEANTAIKELASYKSFDSIMIVGHEPDFSSLIATLLGLFNSTSFHVSNASLSAIELPHISAHAGVLQFMIPASLLL